MLSPTPEILECSEVVGSFNCQQSVRKSSQRHGQLLANCYGESLEEEVTSCHKRRGATFVRSLPGARSVQIFSYLMFKPTPQVDSKNPILQMGKLGIGVGK